MPKIAAPVSEYFGQFHQSELQVLNHLSESDFPELQQNIRLAEGRTPN